MLLGRFSGINWQTLNKHDTTRWFLTSIRFICSRSWMKPFPVILHNGTKLHPCQSSDRLFPHISSYTSWTSRTWRCNRYEKKSSCSCCWMESPHFQICRVKWSSSDGVCTLCGPHCVSLRHEILFWLCFSSAVSTPPGLFSNILKVEKGSCGC